MTDRKMIDRDMTIMHRLRVFLRLSVLIGGLVMPVAAEAATCSAAVTAMAFGNYSPIAATPSDISATATVTCSSVVAIGMAYTVGLSTGNSGTYSTRTLSSGVNALSYQIYTTSARTTVWGDGSAGTSTQPGSFSALLGSSSTPYTLYGRIPAMQNAVPGTYADTITVTVTY